MCCNKLHIQGGVYFLFRKNCGRNIIIMTEKGKCKIKELCMKNSQRFAEE